MATLDPSPELGVGSLLDGHRRNRQRTQEELRPLATSSEVTVGKGPVAQVTPSGLSTTFGHKSDVLLVSQCVGLLGSLEGRGCGRGPPAIHPIEHEPRPCTAGRGKRWSATVPSPGVTWQSSRSSLRPPSPPLGQGQPGHFPEPQEGCVLQPVAKAFVMQACAPSSSVHNCSPPTLSQA